MQARIRKTAIVAAISAALLGAGAGAGYAAAAGTTMSSWHCGQAAVTTMKNGGKLLSASNCRSGDYTSTTRKNLVHVSHPS